MARFLAAATLAGLASLAAFGCGAARASTVVEVVQSPAWLERDGRSVPLAAGIALQRKDRVRTGANARVRLALSDGSAVRLGEEAQLVVERSEDRGGALRASFAVLAGAFRFTTRALDRARPQVAIQVRNVTVGIGGADLWGKSTQDGDLVCLIEGQVSVGTAGHPTARLAGALDVYRKPRAGEPRISRADAAQLEAWARETEIEAEAAGGEWRVVAAVAADRESARVLQRRMRAAGFPAEVAEGASFHELHVTRLASEAQARAVMGNLRAVPGVTLPRVVRVR